MSSIVHRAKNFVFRNHNGLMTIISAYTTSILKDSLIIHEQNSKEIHV